MNVNLFAFNPSNEVICLADEDQDLADVDVFAHHIKDEKEVTPILMANWLNLLLLGRGSTISWEILYGFQNFQCSGCLFISSAKAVYLFDCCLTSSIKLK